MNLPRWLVTGILLGTWLGAPAESRDTVQGAPKHALADITSFFEKPGEIALAQVLDRFGPARMGPLLIGEESKDVKPEHSWWYYELKEGTRVGVQMDRGQVQGVFHFVPRPEGGLTPVAIRQGRPQPAVVPQQTETDKRLPPKGGNWGVREATVKDESLPRVLLIGDSITNGYLDGVRKALDGKANVDAWITPTTQADKSLPKTLEGILGAHAYAIVHFNLGLHGWQAGRIPEGQFEPLTRQLVQNLRQFAPKAKLIWATITPVTVKGEPEKLNPEIQPIIERHNAMALKVMLEEKVGIDDLSSLMLKNLKLAAGDMFHWNPQGRELLVKAVSESLSPALAR